MHLPRRPAAVAPPIAAAELPALEVPPEEDGQTLTLFPIGGRLVALPGPPAAVAVHGAALDGQVPTKIRTGIVPNCQ